LCNWSEDLKCFIYISLFLLPLAGISQNFSQEEQHHIDSLNAIIINPNSHDTSMVEAYVRLSEVLAYSNFDTIIPLCKKAKLIAENALSTHLPNPIAISLKNSLAYSLNNIGFVYDTKGDITKALEYYYKGLKIQEEMGNKLGLATSLNNIGFIYINQGDIPKALNCFHKSLKLYEEVGDKEGIAYSLNNIGVIYRGQGDPSVTSSKEASLKAGFIKALKYYNKSLKINEEIGNREGVARSLNNIGTIYKQQGDIPKALEYCHKSLKIQEEIGHNEGVASSLNNIGYLKMKLGDLAVAQKHLERALKLGQEKSLIKRIVSSAGHLSALYQKQGNTKEALKMYKLHIIMRDSINNEETQKASAQQQAKYEYEKQKVVDDAEHEKQIAIEQEAKEKQQIITYATGGGLGLVGIFLVFVFNRLQVTKKQKLVIETQKQEVEQQKEVVELAHHELEEKNQEITDSIQYAKRIQNAILPPLKVVKEYLTESFILYKPKDIVAGDFYWLESVAPTSKNETTKILFAAADCTGHGVPGAMVSVVCNNGLNRSVREYGLTDPGEILNKTREIVIAEFEKSEEEVKDGMDIAICSLDGTTLKYAGAHNPLWIVRDGELLETKANKQPIGKFDNPEPYTTHTIELQKGDSLYIFSDGYADQFGGEKGKKLKTANFKKLLLSIQNESMERQNQLIDEAFENWKGNLEQLDDVCIIGVKI
jgi:serine phosphatase RsbU (regulator of sigma subunit)